MAHKVGVQTKKKRPQGPTQVVEGIWGKISNDSGVRDALKKVRSYASSGPFVGIVVGTGGESESQPVAFAIVPVLGPPGAGFIRAIDEAVSGKPVSINTVLSAIQSLSALSIPGIVVGTVLSGAVNAVNLLTKGGSHQASSIPAPVVETTTTITIKPEVLQTDSRIDAENAMRDKEDIKSVSKELEAKNRELPLGNDTSCCPDVDESKDESARAETRAVESSQRTVDQRGAEQRGYWYKIIDAQTQNRAKSKL